jgi:hypothetical protein
MYSNKHIKIFCNYTTFSTARIARDVDHNAKDEYSSSQHNAPRRANCDQSSILDHFSHPPESYTSRSAVYVMPSDVRLETSLLIAAR